MRFSRVIGGESRHGSADRRVTGRFPAARRACGGCGGRARGRRRGRRRSPGGRPPSSGGPRRRACAPSRPRPRARRSTADRSASGRLLVEELAPGESARGAAGDEILLAYPPDSSFPRARMLLHVADRPCNWDDDAVARWLEPLGAPRAATSPRSSASGCARRASTWRTARSRGARAPRAGRRARGGGGGRVGAVRLRVAGADEAAVREAVRALRASAGREPLPIRSAPRRARRAESRGRGLRRPTALDPAPDRDPRPPRAAAPPSSGACADRAPRGRRPRAAAPPTRDAAAASRSRGRFTAASRHGDEQRPFAFHAPMSDGAADELKTAAGRGGRAARPAGAASRRARPTSCSPAGCAAVLFHEILGHPLEADAGLSPLSAPLRDGARGRRRARRASTTRGASTSSAATSATTRASAPRAGQARSHSGRRRIAADRPRARGRGPARPGHGRRAGPAEAAAAPRRQRRRLRRRGDLRGDRAPPRQRALDRRVPRRLGRDRERDVSACAFPRARRVRRGRFADELGPGVLAGEMLRGARGRRAGARPRGRARTAASAGARATGRWSRSAGRGARRSDPRPRRPAGTR